MVSEERAGIRQRHVDLTREAILQALVEIIVDGGLTDFSVQQVADRAGVSHRTVYRHFPGRGDLLDGLLAWVEEQMSERGGRFAAADVDELVEAVWGNLAVFETVPDGVEAMTRFSLGTGLEPAVRAERSQMFRRLIEAALPDDADPEQRRMVAGVIRLVISTRAWLVLRQDGIAPPDRLGEALTWALEVLLDAARAGHLPAGGPLAAGQPGDQHPGSASARGV